MKLKTNHWSLWLIRAVSGSDNLPKSRCQYFKKLLYSLFVMLALLPFTIYMLIICLINKDVRKHPYNRELPPGLFLVWSFLGLFTAFIPTENTDSANVLYNKQFVFENLYWLLPLNMIGILILTSVVFGIVGLTLSIEEKIKDYKREKNKKKSRPNRWNYPNQEEYEIACDKWEREQERIEEARKSTFIYGLRQWWKTRKEKICPGMEYISD